MSGKAGERNRAARPRGSSAGFRRRPSFGKGRVVSVKGAVEERAIELGEYIIENNATVRAAAGKFHISKSTVHTVVIIWNAFGG